MEGLDELVNLMEAELAATVAIIRVIAIEKSSAQKGAAFSISPLMKRSGTFTYL